MFAVFLVVSSMLLYRLHTFCCLLWHMSEHVSAATYCSLVTVLPDHWRSNTRSCVSQKAKWSHCRQNARQLGSCLPVSHKKQTCSTQEARLLVPLSSHYTVACMPVSKHIAAQTTSYSGTVKSYKATRSPSTEGLVCLVLVHAAICIFNSARL